MRLLESIYDLFMLCILGVVMLSSCSDSTVKDTISKPDSKAEEYFEEPLKPLRN